MRGCGRPARMAGLYRVNWVARPGRAWLREGGLPHALSGRATHYWKRRLAAAGPRLAMAASIAAVWSGVSDQPMAPAVSSICQGRLAPQRATVIPGWLIVQLTTSWATVRPASAAISRRRATKAWL